MGTSLPGVGVPFVYGRVDGCVHACDTVRTMKDRRVHFKMELKQFEALNKLSEKSGAPISELLRRAVDLYLEIDRQRMTVNIGPEKRKS